MLSVSRAANVFPISAIPGVSCINFENERRKQSGYRREKRRRVFLLSIKFSAAVSLLASSDILSRRPQSRIHQSNMETPISRREEEEELSSRFPRGKYTIPGRQCRCNEHVQSEKRLYNARPSDEECAVFPKTPGFNVDTKRRRRRSRLERFCVVG